VKGSSLPHCSGVPFAWNFAARAFDRWHASWTICAVDEVAGDFVAVAVEVVRTPADDVDVDVDVDVVLVVAVCDQTAEPATAKAAVATAPAIISLRRVCFCFIVTSCVSRFSTAFPIRPSS
jgi:hypothetical protein